MPDSKKKRYSISVSGRTFKRLQTVVKGGDINVHRFVDKLMAGTLDDPGYLARLLQRCPRRLVP